MEKVKYFIGIGLPEKENYFFEEVKRSLDPRGLLKSPPHLTLTPPFRIENLNRIIEDLTSLLNEQQFFELHFSKINKFKQARYVTFFLEPDENHDLRKLKKEIDSITGLKETRPFVPHLTLINSVGYEKENEIGDKIGLMKLELKLLVDKVIIYQQNIDKEWKIKQRILFGRL